MRGNLKVYLLMLALLVISLAATVSVQMEKYHRATEQGRVTVRCDTIVMVDSIIIEKPMVRDSIVTRYVTRYLPVSKAEADTSATVVKEIVSHSNGGIGLSKDSVNVIIPVEQRTYSSELYTAWVSGYEARLDSIALYTREVVVEKEIYLDKKRRRWGCVVGAGVGTNLNWVSPYVGITVGYTLF